MQNRLALLESILKKSQPELKKWLYRELKARGRQPKSRKGFLYAPGTLPVLLVAHLDTVHKSQPTQIYYTADKQRCMAPEGVGGDDRCGVYIILRLLEAFPCHVLFTEDEETGGVGASLFNKSNIRPKLHYILEFDRAGSRDAVFYDCANEDFTRFITGFDSLVEEWGTFSDISLLAPALGVAAVNLSSGYYHAHTKSEYIVIPEMEAMIATASRILAAQTQPFPYIAAYRPDRWGWSRRIMPLDALGKKRVHAGRSAERLFTISREEQGDWGVDKQGGLYILYSGQTAVLIDERIRLYDDDCRELSFSGRLADWFYIEDDCNDEDDEWEAETC